MTLDQFTLELFKVIPYLAIALVIFLLLREFYCWYFKINLRIDLLKQIEENTRPKSAPPTA